MSLDGANRRGCYSSRRLGFMTARALDGGKIRMIMSFCTGCLALHWIRCKGIGSLRRFGRTPELLGPVDHILLDAFHAKTRLRTKKNKTGLSTKVSLPWFLTCMLSEQVCHDNTAMLCQLGCFFFSKRNFKRRGGNSRRCAAVKASRTTLSHAKQTCHGQSFAWRILKSNSSSFPS